jgi:Uma2 family endonuclease
MSTAMHEWPRRHRITVEHFYRMGEAGLFDDNARVELVDGEIIDVPPMGSRHAGTLHLVASALSGELAARALVRQRLPLRLSDDSEPLPDIAVVVPRADHYRSSHPTAADTWLVVEVGDSTLRYDREVKASVYARSNVPEFWIVDVQTNRLHIYRSPLNGEYAVAETFEFGRHSMSVVAGIEIDLTPLALAVTPAGAA